MQAQVRVYGVQKAKGWDVLSSKQMKNGEIPSTATHVYITWGNGSESMKVERDVFLATFTHQDGCYWNAVVIEEEAQEEVAETASSETAATLPQEIVLDGRTYRVNFVYLSGSGNLYAHADYFRTETQKWREVKFDPNLCRLASMAVVRYGVTPEPWMRYVEWSQERRRASEPADPTQQEAA